jgi:hypothetical protein
MIFGTWVKTVKRRRSAGADAGRTARRLFRIPSRKSGVAERLAFENRASLGSLEISDL